MDHALAFLGQLKLRACAAQKILSTYLNTKSANVKQDILGVTMEHIVEEIESLIEIY